MLISDKYRRPWSDAAHHALRLIRAYDICSVIRSFFVDDVTYLLLCVSLLSVTRSHCSPWQDDVDLLHFVMSSYFGRSTNTFWWRTRQSIYFWIPNFLQSFLVVCLWFKLRVHSLYLCFCKAELVMKTSLVCLSRYRINVAALCLLSAFKEISWYLDYKDVVVKNILTSICW